MGPSFKSTPRPFAIEWEWSWDTCWWHFCRWVWVQMFLVNKYYAIIIKISNDNFPRGMNRSRPEESLIVVYLVACLTCPTCPLAVGGEGHLTPRSLSWGEKGGIHRSFWRGRRFQPWRSLGLKELFEENDEHKNVQRFWPRCNHSMAALPASSATAGGCFQVMWIGGIGHEKRGRLVWRRKTNAVPTDVPSLTKPDALPARNLHAAGAPKGIGRCTSSMPQTRKHLQWNDAILPLSLGSLRRKLFSLLYCPACHPVVKN